MDSLDSVEQVLLAGGDGWKKTWDEIDQLWSVGRPDQRNLVRNLLVLAACACARLVIDEVPECDPRPLRAIDTAEAWCRGEKPLDAVIAATNDSSDAFDECLASRADEADDLHRRAVFSATRAAFSAYSEFPVQMAHSAALAASVSHEHMRNALALVRKHLHMKES